MTPEFAGALFLMVVRAFNIVDMKLVEMLLHVRRILHRSFHDAQIDDELRLCRPMAASNDHDHCAGKGPWKNGEGDVRPFKSIGKSNFNLLCSVASANQAVSLGPRCEGSAEA